MGTKAGEALLAELAENPLAGARYAHQVVGLRLAAVEAEAAKPWQDQYETMTRLARELLKEAEHRDVDWTAFWRRLMADG